MKTIFGVLLMLISIQASALQVVMEDGCPVSVDPGSSACPGNESAACVDNGATVRWSAGDKIDSVDKKSGAANLHNCREAGPLDYQCVVQGQSGDSIDYGITVNGCPLDPTIIIR
ncbi:MAG: hypothetical protein HUJ31_13855 [Pseudomonadales bacterium]|nr:hypothetical protein [Pseudomonadales bacterium]